MERGASDEEIGELLGNFNAAMMPEVFGTERFFRELLMDVAPGLGNARSVRHLQNDIAEVERAIETGEWGDAAMASGMAVLDAVGIFPGGNLLKAGGRRLAKGVRAAARPLARLVPRKLKARWELQKFMANWDESFPTATAKEYFAKVWDDLPPHMRTFLDERYKNFAGSAAENIVGKKFDDAGFNLAPTQRGRTFKGALNNQPFTRIYDDVSSEEIKKRLLGFSVRPKRSPKGSGVEVKSNNAELPRHQENADNVIADARAGDLASVAYFRVPATRIEPEDLADVVESWLKNSRRGWANNGRDVVTNSGKIPKKEIEELIKNLRTKTGPDGEPLDIGTVAAMAIGYALTVMYADTAVDETGYMSIDPNAA